MTQNWKQQPQTAPATPRTIPASPGAQPGAGQGGAAAAIQLIESTILQDDAFLMKLMQRMAMLAQGAQSPAGTAGPMTGQ
jgi:hypothetical protein